MRRYLSRKGSGETYDMSNSKALSILFSILMKLFFGIAQRRDDCTMNEERTAKDGLSSCSSLPASMTEVTARTIASGAELLVTA